MQFLQILLNPLNIIVFLLMVTVLVAAHEYGHYLFARVFKMEIEEFALGFGKPRWVFRRATYKVESSGETTEHETEFTLRPWPLGGFVRIAGMQPLEDGSETQIRNGFYSKTPFARWVVLFAGPVFSVLAGILVLVPLYTFSGVNKADNVPVISSISTNGPADKAGLLPGDKIVSLDSNPTPTFISVLKYVRDRPGQKIEVVYERKGELKFTFVIPEKDKTATVVLDDKFEPTEELKIQGKLQMLPGTHLEKLPFGDSFSRAVSLPLKMVQGLIGIALAPSQFDQKMGGPMTILDATAGAVKYGIPGVLELSGLLTISLGILNLLPFPPFDGGQMMIALAEMFRRGRRLGFKVQEKLFGAGTVLVLLLIVGVFWVDIKRYFFTKQDPPKVMKTLETESAASKK